MERDAKKQADGFMRKLAGFIVDKRNLFFLVTLILLIFSAISRNWVEVENDLATYLPDDSETRQGLDVMEEQFVTFGTAQVMVANLSKETAQKLCDKLELLDGIQSIAFDDTADHYHNASALYTVTFDYDQTDQRCLEALDRVEETLTGHDVYISTELGNSLSEIIDAEVSVIMVYVVVIIIVVLMLTSQTWAEVPVLMLTFGIAMLLNQGTNFLLGKISFVSNSVTSVLQLALSLDYAIILCNRYKEEHQNLPIREAVIVALSKGIPEIGASSLTTIGGLVAMMFMQFKIGPDMGICLIKAILTSLLAVFVIMPGLLMLFGPWMDRTKHRNFVPKISFVGKFAYATRRIIPPVFLAVVVIAWYFSNRCPYAYGYGNLETPKLNDTQIAENMIKENFTDSNFVALIVPAGDYQKEGKLLAALEAYDEVDYAMGLSNVEAMDGYVLTDRLTPRQFAELADLDYELAQMIYMGYAAANEDYGEVVGNISTYSVPLIDMFLFVCEQVDSGIVSLDSQQSQMLSEAQVQMTNAKKLLQGKEYSRMLVYLNLPESGDETYGFLDTIRETAQAYYPGGNVYVAGEPTTEADFQISFSRDNIVVTVISILIVLAVLLFTFKSAGMPLLLILVIQGSIWLNFSVPYFTGKELFFMSYLVVSSIQMGANIDYAIVIASRYQELKNQMNHKDAIIETMNFAFPTIITSGMIMAVAGTLIGRMTSEATIVGIGQSIGRGTVISLVLVMFILPQILLLGGDIVDRTSFTMPDMVRAKKAGGRIMVDGLVNGAVNGVVSGTMHAVIEGEVNLNLISGDVREEGVDSDEDKD